MCEIWLICPGAVLHCSFITPWSCRFVDSSSSHSPLLNCLVSSQSKLILFAACITIFPNPLHTLSQLIDHFCRNEASRTKSPLIKIFCEHCPRLIHTCLRTRQPKTSIFDILWRARFLICMLMKLLSRTPPVTKKPPKNHHSPEMFCFKHTLCPVIDQNTELNPIAQVTLAHVIPSLPSIMARTDKLY